MEGTLGEIRLFGGAFAPRGWAFCDGQSLSISAYDALFALIGTTYGGNGVSTFNLPNLQSRVVIGAGTAAGSNIPYLVGQTGGEEEVSLTIANLPSHQHTATVSAGAGNITATLTLNAAAGGAGGESSPGNNLIGSDGSTSVYSANTAKAPGSAMSSASVTFPNATVNANTTTSVTGASIAHENRQPYTATNYIICIEGIFPSRN
ncbi:tail fiber protein [Mucilaginibacter sp. RS28]|uniref:Tail fiber protein n=1 Tax=Mucilaginibacter straminoryzae TaxID=2932774 RepID=A0A9X2BA48_9SPHI|nr:tail fiber protein [Mucilaginibacter straminoryzae]MCJ8211349.1 tail fiber protein [Mucilaginibacter straminoryzae]